MASVTVVLSYNEERGPLEKDFAISVAKLVGPLFVDKKNVEVHIAKGSAAVHILGTLADQRT